MKITAPLRISDIEEFQNSIDDIDPFICSMDSLQELIDDAPGMYEQGFLCGVHAVRVQLECITGRSC